MQVIEITPAYPEEHFQIRWGGRKKQPPLLFLLRSWLIVKKIYDPLTLVMSCFF